jgi:cysteine-rich repeat protein
VITAGEQCDDSNAVALDGCSETCMFEVGWDCTNVGYVTTCEGTCGDGKMKTREVCDDGTLGDNKGCKDDCTGPLPGWTCIGGTADTAIGCTEVCGDDIITVSEQCEDVDGGPTSGDGCSSTC